MNNPWMARNPFLSMWLSAANSTLGAARGQALSFARQQQAAMMNEAGKAMFAFWTGAAAAPKSSKRKRRSK